MDTFCGAAADNSGLFAGDADDTFRQPDAAAEDVDEDILVREGVVVVVG